MRLTVDPPGNRSLAADRVPIGWACVLLVGALAATFELDRATDAAPVQHLYYLPVIFAALRFGTRGGLVLSAAAIVLYHIANPHLISFRYEETDLVQVVLFAAVGLVASRLADDARQLQRLAMTDDLTGLHNLRSFEAHLRAMVRVERETGRPLSVLVLDLDRLKSLNDVHGHLVGAAAVQAVGQVIGARLPSDAVACRYGGDEFVIALPDHTRARALEFARKLCADVQSIAPRLAGMPFPAGRLTISVGVAGGIGPASPARAAVPRDHERGETLFKAADEALYAAKRRGRNGVCEAEEWSCI